MILLMLILNISLLGFSNTLIIIALMAFLSFTTILCIHSKNHQEHNHNVENNEQSISSIGGISYPGGAIGGEFLHQNIDERANE